MNFTHIMKEWGLGRSVSTVTKLRMIMCASDDESLPPVAFSSISSSSSPYIHYIPERMEEEKEEKSPPTHTRIYVYTVRDYEIKAPKTCWAQAFLAW